MERSKSLLLEEKGDRLRWMRWKNQRHLISHFVTASPQGEAKDIGTNTNDRAVDPYANGA